MPSILIAGLGVSGLGCAVELAHRRIPFRAIEREERPGGLAKSERAGEFRFDYGPHVLLGRRAELDNLFRDLPALQLQGCIGTSGVMLDGRLDGVIPAPFQRHLYRLPVNLRLRLLMERVLRPGGGKGSPPTNYAEYAIRRCGQGVYDLFLRDYDTKRLRFPLDAIPATGRIESTGHLCGPSCIPAGGRTATAVFSTPRQAVSKRCHAPWRGDWPEVSRHLGVRSAESTYGRDW